MAQTWQRQQKGTYDFYTLTNKNLYLVVEKIAEKEIEKNPIDFIKRESFQVGGTEEFYSFVGDDDHAPGHHNGQKIEEEDDEEDSPNDDDDEEENLEDGA
jgi:hypothetical protein